jgi:N-acetylmuramoyl-L-alanine amidase
MPAVRIELGYLTNPGDAARLGSAEFRDELAEAIVVAIQRLYSPAELPSQEAIERRRQTISV